MSAKIVVMAEAIDDDVLIPLPEEFGFKVGDQFEAVKRSDGAIVLTCSGQSASK